MDENDPEFQLMLKEALEASMHTAAQEAAWRAGDPITPARCHGPDQGQLQVHSGTHNSAARGYSLDGAVQEVKIPATATQGNGARLAQQQSMPAQIQSGTASYPPSMLLAGVNLPGIQQPKTCCDKDVVMGMTLQMALDDAATYAAEGRGFGLYMHLLRRFPKLRPGAACFNVGLVSLHNLASSDLLVRCENEDGPCMSYEEWDSIILHLVETLFGEDSDALFLTEQPLTEPPPVAAPMQSAQSAGDPDRADCMNPASSSQAAHHPQHGSHVLQSSQVVVDWKEPSGGWAEEYADMYESEDDMTWSSHELEGVALRHALESVLDHARRAQICLSHVPEVFTLSARALDKLLELGAPPDLEVGFMLPSLPGYPGYEDFEQPVSLVMGYSLCENQELSLAGLDVLQKHGALNGPVLSDLKLAGIFGRLPLLPLEAALQLPHTTHTALPRLLATTSVADVQRARAERRKLLYSNSSMSDASKEHAGIAVQRMACALIDLLTDEAVLIAFGHPGRLRHLHTHASMHEGPGLQGQGRAAAGSSGVQHIYQTVGRPLGHPGPTGEAGSVDLSGQAAPLNAQGQGRNINFIPGDLPLDLRLYKVFPAERVGQAGPRDVGVTRLDDPRFALVRELFSELLQELPTDLEQRLSNTVFGGLQLDRTRIAVEAEYAARKQRKQRSRSGAHTAPYAGQPPPLPPLPPKPVLNAQPLRSVYPLQIAPLNHDGPSSHASNLTPHAVQVQTAAGEQVCAQSSQPVSAHASQQLQELYELGQLQKQFMQQAAAAIASASGAAICPTLPDPIHNDTAGADVQRDLACNGIIHRSGSRQSSLPTAPDLAHALAEAAASGQGIRGPLDGAAVTAADAVLLPSAAGTQLFIIRRGSDDSVGGPSDTGRQAAGSIPMATTAAAGHPLHPVSAQRQPPEHSSPTRAGTGIVEAYTHQGVDAFTAAAAAAAAVGRPRASLQDAELQLLHAHSSKRAKGMTSSASMGGQQQYAAASAEQAAAACISGGASGVVSGGVAEASFEQVLNADMDTCGGSNGQHDGSSHSAASVNGSAEAALVEALTNWRQAKKQLQQQQALHAVASSTRQEVSNLDSKPLLTHEHVTSAEEVEGCNKEGMPSAQQGAACPDVRQLANGLAQAYEQQQQQQQPRVQQAQQWQGQGRVMHDMHDNRRPQEDTSTAAAATTTTAYNAPAYKSRAAGNYPTVAASVTHPPTAAAAQGSAAGEAAACSISHGAAVVAVPRPVAPQLPVVLALPIRRWSVGQLVYYMDLANMQVPQGRVIGTRLDPATGRVLRYHLLVCLPVPDTAVPVYDTVWAPPQQVLPWLAAGQEIMLRTPCSCMQELTKRSILPLQCLGVCSNEPGVPGPDVHWVVGRVLGMTVQQVVVAAPRLGAPQCVVHSVPWENVDPVAVVGEGSRTCHAGNSSVQQQQQQRNTGSSGMQNQHISGKRSNIQQQGGEAGSYEADQAAPATGMHASAVGDVHDAVQAYHIQSQEPCSTGMQAASTAVQADAVVNDHGMPAYEEYAHRPASASADMASISGDNSEPAIATCPTRGDGSAVYSIVNDGSGSGSGGPKDSRLHTTHNGIGGGHATGGDDVSADEVSHGFAVQG